MHKNLAELAHFGTGVVAALALLFGYFVKRIVESPRWGKQTVSAHCSTRGPDPGVATELISGPRDEGQKSWRGVYKSYPPCSQSRKWRGEIRRLCLMQGWAPVEVAALVGAWSETLGRRGVLGIPPAPRSRSQRLHRCPLTETSEHAFAHAIGRVTKISRLARDPRSRGPYVWSGY